MSVPLIELDVRMPLEGLRFDRVLFLDIDGVLHPDGPGDYDDFCCLPRFCEVLRAADPMAQLPIVLSSAWRHTRRLEDIKQHFPQDIRDRIVGVTPSVAESDALSSPTCPNAAGTGRRPIRQDEIDTWMGRYTMTGQWLAVDDRASGFEDRCPQLFLVPGTSTDGGGPGITPKVADQLRARLESFLQRTATPDTATAPGPAQQDMRRVLFLDFDGVLHPQHESHVSPFGYMDNFCSVLREVDPHGQVPIVISSSWRLLFPIDELRAYFPSDIAARILGTTPFLLPVNPDLHGSREREIMDWMAAHAPGGQWLAVDDIAMYFATDCPHLFLVDEDFAQMQTPADEGFALMAEIEERERLTALWQSRGLGINLRVADKLRRRLQEFVCLPPGPP